MFVECQYTRLGTALGAHAKKTLGSCLRVSVWNSPVREWVSAPRAQAGLCACPLSVEGAAASTFWGPVEVAQGSWLQSTLGKVEAVIKFIRDRPQQCPPNIESLL